MLGTIVSLLSLLKYLLWCEKIHIVSNWQSGLVVPVCRFQHYCIRDIHIASNAQFLGVSSPRVVLRNICFSVNGINKQALSHLMWARAIQLAVNLDRAKRQKKVNSYLFFFLPSSPIFFPPFLTSVYFSLAMRISVSSILNFRMHRNKYSVS